MKEFCFSTVLGNLGRFNPPKVRDGGVVFLVLKDGARCLGSGWSEEEVFGAVGGDGRHLVDTKNGANIFLMISTSEMKRCFPILVGNVSEKRFSSVDFSHIRGSGFAASPMERAISFAIPHQKRNSVLHKRSNHINPGHGGIVERGGSLRVSYFTQRPQRNHQFLHELHVSRGHSEMKRILSFKILGQGIGPSLQKKPD